MNGGSVIIFGIHRSSRRSADACLIWSGKGNLLCGRVGRL